MSIHGDEFIVVCSVLIVTLSDGGLDLGFAVCKYVVIMFKTLVD